MEEHDSEGLMQRFKQALDHIRESGRLHDFDLQLPVVEDFTFKQRLHGYVGGTYDPEALGVACIVVPPPQGRRGPNSKGDFGLNPVSSREIHKSNSSRSPPLIPATARQPCIISI